MPRLLLDLGYEFAFVNIRGFLDRVCRARRRASESMMRTGTMIRTELQKVSGKSSIFRFTVEKLLFDELIPIGYSHIANEQTCRFC